MIKVPLLLQLKHLVLQVPILVQHLLNRLIRLALLLLPLLTESRRGSCVTCTLLVN